MSLVAVIDFTPEAKRYCCFDETTMKIYLKNEKGEVVEEMDFNSYNLEKLRKEGIPIIKRLDTSSCTRIPRKMFILGRLFAGEILG